MTRTETVPCNLCHADNAEVVYDRGVAQIARIVRCRDCDLMYASPRGQLVDHEDYERWEVQGVLADLARNPDHPFRWRYDKESLQVRDFDRTRALLHRLHPAPGKMVEVGSGLGFLLRSFQDEGWEVLGVDPWRELSVFTEAEHGFETIPTTLEAAQLPDASADVMVLLHVIEHVPDPVATLREIHRVLKPGGHLVMETPRYDTLTFRLMGKRERSVRQDGHIYFFTDETLKRTYERAGFREIDTSHVGRSLTAERFMWNAANVFKSPGLTRAATRLSHRLGLQKLRFSMNLADMVRVVVEKPAD